MAALKSAILGTVVPMKTKPVAKIATQPSFGVIGSVIRMNGNESFDADGTALTFKWSFVDPPPIGSRVVAEGFQSLEEDDSVVTFSPDVVGEYNVRLIVSNGVFDSDPVVATISIRALLVPHGRGIVPDGKFIWSYLRDVWSEVSNKEWFETLWSALIQITGGELLKLYQTDFNKSIRDIQDNFQRRWLKYEPKLQLSDDCSFYLGRQCAGSGATTSPLDTYAVIISEDEIIVVRGTVYPSVLGEQLTVRTSLGEDNLGTYRLSGLNSKKNGYRLKAGYAFPDPTADLIVGIPGVAFYFDFQSKIWSIDPSPGSDMAEQLSTQQTLLDTLTDLPPMGAMSLSSLRGGDVIYFPSGPNAGFYSVVQTGGGYVTVDKAPPSFSDVTLSETYKAYIYRPVQITVSQPDLVLGDSFSVPYESGDNDLSQLASGRLVLVGDQAFTLTRTMRDTRQWLDLTVGTVDETEIPTGLRGLFWRAPSTLISETMNFEDLGVSTGDTLVWDVEREGTSLVGEIRTQVVGVDRNRLGFVLSVDALDPGIVSGSASDRAIYDLAMALQIDDVRFAPSGELLISGDAAAFLAELETAVFQRKYWNTSLTHDSDITVNGVVFRIRPKHVLRNSLVPVDETLVSVPALQEFITRPSTFERDGRVYQVVRGKEYLLDRAPVALTENSDFVVDGQTMLHGEINFRPGRLEIFADGTDFMDRGVRSGDTFEIESPSVLAGKYVIHDVIGRHTLRLTRAVPTYFSEWVTARVLIKRKNEGNFIRFAPGVFSAANPAPPRLWAEVSFFDNGPTIESNFGILVGLKREDLESLTSNLSYRQAVAGLMYAYSRGPELDRVRLGAQILLGLPFAEHRGIVRSIEPVYRFNLNGDPQLGRILVEDIDKEGNALGTMRAYTFPLDPESDLAGLDENPTTGLSYVVGDTVELFAPLCKGVRIVDYLVEALQSSNAIQILQQFHSLKVQVNDNLFGFEEIKLVSDFLKKITPSYISVFLSSLTEVDDDAPVLDDVSGVVGTGESTIIDDASFSIPTPLVSDSKTIAGLRLIRTDLGVMNVRREGRDLETVFGSALASTSAGGLLDPKSHESFEGELCKPGDKLYILSGDNEGFYDIESIPSDSTMNLVDAEFSSGTGQRFAVLRPLSAVLREGTASLTSGSAVVEIEEGVRVDLVSPGDWLIAGGKRYLILRVGPSSILVDPFGIIPDSPALLAGQVLVSPPPSSTESISYKIYRPALLGNPHEEEFEVEGDGSSILVSVDDVLTGLLEAGDELQIQDDTLRRFTVITTRDSIFTSPDFPTGIANVKLCKPDRFPGLFGISTRRRDPVDQVDVSWVETALGAVCSSGSANVQLYAQRTSSPAGTLDPFNPYDFFRAGDLLILEGSGNGAVDVGYGAGVYPIVEVQSGQIVLAVNLTVTESVAWTVQRVRSL